MMVLRAPVNARIGNHLDTSVLVLPILRLAGALPALTFEHFMWLQPSFFWIGDLQLGQGLLFVTSHRQLAASSVSTPEAGNSSGFTSAIFCCHSCHWAQLLGAWASPRHSLHSKVSSQKEEATIYKVPPRHDSQPTSKRNVRFHSRPRVTLQRHCASSELLVPFPEGARLGHNRA